MPASVKFYRNAFYRNGSKTDLLDMVYRDNITNAIVFVDPNMYTNVFRANSPTLDGEVIYARNLGERNRLLMEYYPNRKYYLAGSSLKVLDLQR